VVGVTVWVTVVVAMTSLVFRTPGVLDLRALTTFGMSSKPNSTSPIGIFGTGLKYAVAVMVTWTRSDSRLTARRSTAVRSRSRS
jgi:hypothetical protein